jgi:hypothetical protein
MKSLERRFNKITKENPYWSSYICFAEAISGQKFSRQTIHRWFNKLVEKDDYDKKDKRALLKQLIELTQKSKTIPEDNEF